jgi:DNA-binding transcriptional regulator GbsR (MarR family)
MNDNQLEFDLGENEVTTDVAVEESSPENLLESPQEQRSELDEVSDNVQKRISKLTARMREAERREQAAVEFARGLQTEKHSLQQSLVNTDYSRLSEAKNRLDTQQATLKAIIRKAREEGDVDTETEAVQRLTDLTMEQRQVAGWLQSQGEQVQQMQRQPVQQYVPQEAPPQKPMPSPKAEEWATRNPWFGQDRMLTYGAWGIHQILVEQEGVDPNSDEYYTELDRRLRDEFPRRFQDQIRQQRSAPAVAPASRSSGLNTSARRTVRLSPSQVAIAKKLGVPLEEYAKYVKE